MGEQREIRDVQALRAFARELAAQLAPGRVLALAGPMGAGKTTLVRELVELLGLDAREVRSPTFSLVNVYGSFEPGLSPGPHAPLEQARASRPRGAAIDRVYHIDLYRAESEADLAGIDIEDYLYDADAVVFVEWPERIAGRLPPGALAVRLEFAPELGDQGRRALLEERR